jgi:hypothetical protein
MMGSSEVGSTTRLALSYIFAGVQEEPMRKIAGLNAVAVYGFDGAALAKTATKIGAPTVDQLSVAPDPDAIPIYWSNDD